LSRVLPGGLRAELDWDSWPRPPVFHWLAGHVAEDELRRVFNLGIGWCAVVARPEPDELVIGRIA
jgi:phosphoribosylaminoimidazole (AIR) synthetase